MPDEFVTDWVNLPPGFQVISLSDGVQDAQLRTIQSDLRARTVTIEFVPLALVWTAGLAFTFTLERVESVRALRYAFSPRGLRVPPGSAAENQQRLAAKNRGRSRDESESWEAFELAVACDEQAELKDGDLVRDANGTTALRLEIQMGDGDRYEIFIRAQGLRIGRSDGQAFPLEQFLELTNAYLEALEKRQEGTE